MWPEGALQAHVTEGKEAAFLAPPQWFYELSTSVRSPRTVGVLYAMGSVQAHLDDCTSWSGAVVFYEIGSAKHDFALESRDMLTHW